MAINSVTQGLHRYRVSALNAGGRSAATNIAALRDDMDHDGDGMPDTWELARGLNAADPGDALLDTDGDGRTNMREYLDGTDPNVVNLLPPTGLTAQADDGVINLAWQPVPAAASYTVWRTPLSGGSAIVVTSGSSATAFTDTTVTNGESYQYVVAAANAAGPGPASAPATATPVASDRFLQTLAGLEAISRLDAGKVTVRLWAEPRSTFWTA